MSEKKRYDQDASVDPQGGQTPAEDAAEDIDKTPAEEQAGKSDKEQAGKSDKEQASESGKEQAGESDKDRTGESDKGQEASAPEETAPASEADELRKKLDETNDKYLRMLAEYDNYRRRSARERESIYADVRADTIGKLLPIYDNLLRAASQEPDETARKGMEAIAAQFDSILHSLGVKEIEAVGKRFDPALHEAMLHIEDEKYGEGEIVLELERGFKLGDRVIRFSKVQVAN